MSFKLSGRIETRRGDGTRRVKYPVNFAVFSWFAGLFVILYFMYKTFISIDALFHIFLLFGLLATGINYYFHEEKGKKVLFELALYNFMGVATLLSALFLAINFNFRSDNYIETYKIQKVSQSFSGPYLTPKKVSLENNAYEKYSYIMDYDQWTRSEINSAEEIKLTLADGLFGFKVLIDDELISEN